MRKWIALILSLTFVLALAGCNKGTDTMYQLGIVVDGCFMRNLINQCQQKLTKVQLLDMSVHTPIHFQKKKCRQTLVKI